MIHIRLFGPFAISDSNGVNMTPRSAKACAIIAMLVRSKGGRRSRVWLQDKLWSSSAPGQASGSLRQAILELRKALRAHADVLHVDRTALQLDLGAVEIEAAASGDELLEGLDCRDAEFETWLRDERQHHISPTVPQGSCNTLRTQRRFRIALVVPQTLQGRDGAFIGIVADTLARALTERALVEVLLPEAAEGEAEIQLELRYHPEPRILRAVAVATESRRHIWSDTLRLAGLFEQPGHALDIGRMVGACVDAVILAMLQGLPAVSSDQAALHRIVRQIFTFDSAAMLAADRDLASFGSELPTTLGWHLLLRMILRVECAAQADQEFLEQTRDLLERALLVGANDTMVLCAAAHACIKIFDRPDEAVLLARRALDRSWANPFALDVLSDALLLQGRTEESYGLALQAQAIGQSTSISHFFDMGLCLASVATGRLDDALRLARQAASLAPNFRPPLRYAGILMAAANRHHEANAMFDRLRRIEPGFAISFVAEDEFYPVATIRRAGLTRAVDKVVRI